MTGVLNDEERLNLAGNYYLWTSGSKTKSSRNKEYYRRYKKYRR
jgi:hypothetical protein